MRNSVARLQFDFPSDALSQKFVQKIAESSTCTLRSADGVELDPLQESSPLEVTFAGSEADLIRLFALVACYEGKLIAAAEGIGISQREVWRLARQARIAPQPAKHLLAFTPLEIFTGACHRLLDSPLGRFLDYRVLLLLAVACLYEGQHRMRLAFVRLDESSFTVVTSTTSRGNRLWSASIDHKEENRRRDEHQTQNTILFISLCTAGVLLVGLGICVWSRH